MTEREQKAFDLGTEHRVSGLPCDFDRYKQPAIYHAYLRGYRGPHIRMVIHQRGEELFPEHWSDVASIALQTAQDTGLDVQRQDVADIILTVALKALETVWKEDKSP